VQIARAAENLGFVGALTPTGAWCEDAWLTTAMLVPQTERLKFLVAFRPGSVSPTLAAQQAPPTSATPAAGCCPTSSLVRVRVRGRRGWCRRGRWG